MPRIKAKQSDPLDIPDFLRISPAERQRAWAEHPPQPTTLLERQPAMLMQTQHERRRERARVRLERLKQRKQDSKLRTQLFPKMEGMLVVKFKRLEREMPTEQHRNMLHAMFRFNGKCYIRTSPALVQNVPPVGRASGHKPSRRVDTAFSLQMDACLKDHDLRPRLRELARANNIWKDSYDALDNGRLRMTVGNVLRAKAKRGENIKWLEGRVK